MSTAVSERDFGSGNEREEGCNRKIVGKRDKARKGKGKGIKKQWEDSVKLRKFRENVK